MASGSRPLLRTSLAYHGKQHELLHDQNSDSIKSRNALRMIEVRMATALFMQNAFMLWFPAGVRKL